MLGLLFCQTGLPFFLDIQQCFIEIPTIVLNNLCCIRELPDAIVQLLAQRYMSYHPCTT